MSLQITSTIKTNQGIALATSYGRVSVSDDFSGDTLAARVNLYATESAFLGGKQVLSTQLVTVTRVAYDRETMSTDILDLAHDILITVLAEQGVTATKEL